MNKFLTVLLSLTMLGGCASLKQDIKSFFKPLCEKHICNKAAPKQEDKPKQEAEKPAKQEDAAKPSDVQPEPAQEAFDDNEDD